MYNIWVVRQAITKLGISKNQAHSIRFKRPTTQRGLFLVVKQCLDAKLCCFMSTGASFVGSRGMDVLLEVQTKL